MATTISKLIQQNNELSRRVAALESGEAYHSMRDQMRETAAYADKRIEEEKRRADEAVQQARRDVCYYQRELRKRDQEHAEDLKEAEKTHASVVRDLQKQITSLAGEIARCDLVIKNLMEENDRLSNRNKDIVSQYNTLRDAYEELSSKYEKLSKLPSQDAVVAFYKGRYDVEIPDTAENELPVTDAPGASADNSDKEEKVAPAESMPAGAVEGASAGSAAGAAEGASDLDNAQREEHVDEGKDVSSSQGDSQPASEGKEGETKEASASNGAQQDEESTEPDPKLVAALEESNKTIQELKDALKAEKKQSRKLAVQVLKGRLNKDSQTSNFPSSLTPFRKDIPNNRSKTGRKQGGQPEHDPNYRMRFEADRVVYLTPDDVAQHPEKYVKTGKSQAHDEKELAALFINTQYVVEEYKNIETGEVVKAAFPSYLQNETNYGPMLKAYMLLEKDRSNVSERKIVESVTNITGGKLKPSRSMINGLNIEFALKAKAELDQIFISLLNSLVMYTDTTNGKQSGKHRCVSVYSNKESVLYKWDRKGGDESAKDSPLIGYKNVLVHDHAAMNYHYGGLHQECLAHIIRRLLAVILVERENCWPRKVRKLLRKMIFTRKKMKGVLPPELVAQFRKEYDVLLKVAFREYEDRPPLDYVDGYNLAVTLRDYKEAVLLFLVDPNVDPTNNGSERLLRLFKMHQSGGKQFRGESDLAGIAYSDTMSVLETAILQGKNLMEFAADIFKRDSPVSMKKARAYYKEKAKEENAAEAKELAAKKAKKAKKANNTGEARVAKSTEIIKNGNIVKNTKGMKSGTKVDSSAAAIIHQ